MSGVQPFSGDAECSAQGAEDAARLAAGAMRDWPARAGVAHGQSCDARLYPIEIIGASR